jgi:hypothetical protein
MSTITKIFIIACIVFGNLFLPTFSQAATSNLSAVKDSDYDGLTDQGENQVYKTNPQNPDTDGDAYLDGAEVLSGTNPLDANSPASGVLTTTTKNNIDTSLWPWYFARASGLVAYILLFLLVVSGMGIKTSWSFRFISPTFAWLNHRYLGLALTFSVAVHLISLLVDNFLKFTILDILVPFVSPYKPLFLSLGIIGFYLFLAVIITSIFTMTKFYKTWRLLHYLPYPLFIILFIHGYFIGTDTSLILVKSMYLVTGLIFTLLGVYRLYFFYKQK